MGRTGSAFPSQQFAATETNRRARGGTAWASVLSPGRAIAPRRRPAAHSATGRRGRPPVTKELCDPGEYLGILHLWRQSLSNCRRDRPLLCTSSKLLLGYSHLCSPPGPNSPTQQQHSLAMPTKQTCADPATRRPAARRLEGSNGDSASGLGTNRHWRVVSCMGVQHAGNKKPRLAGLFESG